jgi:hypothetical protein
MIFLQRIVDGRISKWTMTALCIFILNVAFAQPPGGGRGRGGAPGMEMTARVYGKIMDTISNSVLEYAVVRITDDKSKLINGALTERNGDFSIDKIPVGRPVIIELSMIGYNKKVFGFTIQPGQPPIEKDLGNIKLMPTVSSTLEIKDENGFRKEFDKSIYDVEKNAINAGGTAEDVLRNIPIVQVDQDGNVSVRNTAPQIFVDGRPTTLSIDQIPADAISRVEIITNPSAKYDASGGGGGILNIVMKQNRGRGYNGSVRSGINTVPPNVFSKLNDKYRYNGGIDFNIRQGKVNFFVNANLNQRRSYSYANTSRQDLGGLPLLADQYQTSINNGYFSRGSAGMDWFIDNRNTLTFSESINKGAFRPDDSLHVDVDTLRTGANINGEYYRRSTTERVFKNVGSSVLYKHLFTKEGTELTADFNYNRISSNYNGDYKNIYSNAAPSIWKQYGGVAQQLYTFQMDFVSKLNEKYKLELGRRFSLRDYNSGYDNEKFDLATQTYMPNNALKVDYSYREQIEALYSTLSVNGDKWKYQFGLRAESSNYRGTLNNTGQSFKIVYPISLFPSVYVTRVIDETQDFQIALNRRINRPSFMQLSPFTDYSDSLNVSRGNPNLRPEFTHSAELSYMKTIKKGHSIIASLYSRYTTNVTIKQQLTEYSPILKDTIVVTTSMNALYGWASGLEVVSRNAFTQWLDLTTTLNVYNSTIDGSNITPNLTNSINSYWVKMQASIKLPKSTVIQINGDYASKKALDVGSSERGGGGGMGGGMGGGGMMGGPVNTVQGFIRPNYGIDLSLRKSFSVGKSSSKPTGVAELDKMMAQKGKGNENLTLSISYNDILHTRVTSMYSNSPYFIQDSHRYRDWQTWRINLSWKFGKMDASLFKRKNNKVNADGMEG